ncbi:MAG: hypothetical protein LBJ10_00425, partial [Clostridiales bacterium]|nr:hypothetical protein [Clostridiales bacterium]
MQSSVKKRRGTMGKRAAAGRAAGKRLAALFGAAALCLALARPAAFAAESTTYTYAISVNFDTDWIRTQDAYVPAGVYLQGAGLSKPEDMFFRGGKLYIADTGNGRIAVYDIKTGGLGFVGEGVLSAPTGLYVAEGGEIYAADYGSGQVYGFGADGTPFLAISRPQTYLFSEQSAFKPRAVAVSSGKTIYVAGEGAFEGLMQFDSGGEFLGYFGANPRDISAFERMQEIILSEVQKERVMRRIPRPVTSLAISGQDMVYTVTSTPFKNRHGEDSSIYNSIRKLNMAGDNILDTGEWRMVDMPNYTDIAVSGRGCIFALSQTGVITEYDPNGEVVFSFGGRAASAERIGLFTLPVAVALDENDFVYVLDKERALVQAYYPTAFAGATHRAIEA